MTTAVSPASLRRAQEAVAVVCGVDPAGLSATTALAGLGADSLVLVGIADVLEADLAASGAGRLRIDDADLARFETIGEIARYVDRHLQAVPAP